MIKHNKAHPQKHDTRFSTHKKVLHDTFTSEKIC